MELASGSGPAQEIIVYQREPVEVDYLFLEVVDREQPVIRGNGHSQAPGLEGRDGYASVF